MNRAIIKQQWDRVLAIGTALAGVVLLVIGWFQVSGTGVVAEQIPFLASQTVGGLICFGVATTLWISADLRDEWAKLDDIYRAVDGGAISRNSPEVAPDAADANVGDAASRHRRDARATAPIRMEESLT